MVTFALSAPALLPVLATLMLADLLLTRKWLQRGLKERNPAALHLMARHGSVGGLFIYQLTRFIVFSIPAFLFPSQWLLPLWICGSPAISVVRNLRLLSKRRGR